MVRRRIRRGAWPPGLRHQRSGGRYERGIVAAPTRRRPADDDETKASLGAQAERPGAVRAGGCFAWRRRLTGRVFVLRVLARGSVAVHEGRSQPPRLVPKGLFRGGSPVSPATSSVAVAEPPGQPQLRRTGRGASRHSDLSPAPAPPDRTRGWPGDGRPP